MPSDLKANFKNNIFSPLGILGILILISILFFSNAMRSGLSNISILTNGQGITVSGTAEKLVTSDRASMSLVLKLEAKNLSDNEAIKKLSETREALVKYLIKSDIQEEDINILSYEKNSICSLRDKDNWDNCLGSKYNEYTQIIDLASNNILKIKDFSLNINSYINNENNKLINYFEKINLSVVNTQYLYTKLADLKTKMLNEATKNAFERAEAIAQSTNNKAGAVISASQGVFQVTTKDSISDNDYGSYDTSTIDKKITAVVRVSFKVK